MILEDKCILQFVLLPILPFESAIIDVRLCKTLIFLAVQSFTKDYARRFTVLNSSSYELVTETN